jgi:p-aminobenzoyl-glutamate transporter AbgT
LEKFKTYAIAAVTAIWATLAPIHVLIYALFFLVGADFVGGIWKALKNKEPITSRRMRETVAKLAGYMLALLAAFAVDHILDSGEISLARLAAAGLAIVEIKSLAESLTVILGFDPLAAVIAKLKPPPKEPDNGI